MPIIRYLSLSLEIEELAMGRRGDAQHKSKSCLRAKSVGCHGDERAVHLIPETWNTGVVMILVPSLKVFEREKMC